MVNGKGPSSITLPEYFKTHGGYWTVGAGKIFHPGMNINYTVYSKFVR